ncbi:bifunctional rhamnulose-1-phosphate aldolase/short-chain dehydrogenase [Lichenicola cladoniae]|uniref:Bifunctional rhamnulose-1-phosphate aldolase/short-chain dehydrogenase n=1 Tax=Lichenicola cladoniae TaxID=1484109 RepID=A0A6M8HT78_9PROT|nr:bifunctional rhamnulose-1-phosphate aldolase/short-chain dehydrogenase [Lichenicola cladoniae]NPD67782.1 bifunctional rhamnulose-1-phosphate aldolase/short-chain dehydrogenase [Acetobacteraceae bacterium]QKE91703.1 bifunctional rhamnulose-1-phosphate aldolase/short-chain dehydrogenase [Lichenicola cladoniae]
MDYAETSTALLEDRWDEVHAADLSPEALLLYRSNLLGSDKRVTNYGGGNTSSKLAEIDPLTGETVAVLWVKGSGGDIGTMKLDGFSTLYSDRLVGLQALYKGPEHEDAMVGLYPHLTFNLNPRATSIDTPLHGLISHPHVDHVHPDAIIAIAASADSERLTREIFGGEIGWVPWRRPGFELGLWLKRFVDENPGAKGVVLEAHGLFTWGQTQRDCYGTTIRTINRAVAWLADQSRGHAAFGGEKVAALPVAERRAIAAALMPQIRGLIGLHGVDGKIATKIGHFDDSPVVLEFIGSHALSTLAPLGTSCPDHFLRTKIAPLVIDFVPGRETLYDILPRLEPAIAAYRAGYAAYYERCKRPDSPAMRDANAVVYLIPGVGMITFASDKATARIASEFYTNAINVMRGASSVSTYRGLPEQEAFDIEYWLLEEAKLSRMPRPKTLAGKVVLITGGAGGIGMATARRLADEGACVVICDIDRTVLDQSQTMLRLKYGADAAVGLWVDVTSEDAVIALYAEAAIAFGGVDICVSNAGIASAAPIEDTTLALWDRNMSILATGYFLVTREAFRMMKTQKSGGSIVVVASKNAMVASPGASAYCVAKASEVHLARCLALEGAAHGIRANVVNPDAVLRGSRIWEGEWGAQRAASNKTNRQDLERVYIERSMLKRGVYPEDIAEAIAFFAAEDRSGKSTGNIINVDAGHAPSFSR